MDRTPDPPHQCYAKNPELRTRQISVSIQLSIDDDFGGGHDGALAPTPKMTSKCPFGLGRGAYHVGYSGYQDGHGNFEQNLDYNQFLQFKRQKELQKQYQQMHQFQQQAASQPSQLTQAIEGPTQTLHQGQFTNQQPVKDYSSVMVARQSQMNPVPMGTFNLEWIPVWTVPYKRNCYA
uniref:Uncharacterized protein n=1 Tax=Romanomermis culicivorax TaxID=13658 RepID=A0A915ILY2_ROMCU